MSDGAPQDPQHLRKTPIRKGPIAWFANNSVAANLMMVLLMAGGLLMAFQVKQEVFPEVDLDIINVQVVYPGALPGEVEQGVLLAVEEGVRGIDGVKRVTSTASENVGVTTIELQIGTDPDRALADVKNAVDRIVSFPEDAERPIVSLLNNRAQVISLILYGEMDEKALRSYAERIRDEILSDPRVTQADLVGARDLEISIEIPQETLRKHNLTLELVAAKIRAASVELGAGGIKTEGGEVLLKLDERRSEGTDYRDIVIASTPTGGELLLGDIAIINDGFAETDESAAFLGKPAMMIQVFRTGDETPLEVAGAVKEYMERTESSLPPGVEYAVWQDWSDIYWQRVELLLRNAGLGLLLVLGVLALFLEIRLAFWVTLGIPISFLGALLFMPAWDVSINMISLFAFIVVLGMVVDDAIVVGENAYARRRQGIGKMDAAMLGAQDVAKPVCFAIATSVVAFMPMFFVPGVMGKFFSVIPAIVISVLLMSLVESLWILPAHVGHESKGLVSHAIDRVLNWGPIGLLQRGQQRFSAWFETAVEKYYGPLARFAVQYRYGTAGVCIALLLITLGLVVGGRIDRSFFPKIESDVVQARVVLPYGAPVEETERIRQRLEGAAVQLIDKHGGDDILRGRYSQLGAGIAGGGPRGGSVPTGSHVAEVAVFFVPSDQRDFTAAQFTQEWRELVGEVAGVESLTFKFTTGPSAGNPIEIQLSHRDESVLQQGAARVAKALENYSGVKDIEDGFLEGKPQLNFQLTSAATSLGLSEADVGRQVRSSFFGVEAVRQQRGRHEIRTYVRLPRDDRETQSTLDTLMVRGPTGAELPLGTAAEVERTRAPTEIKRVDSRRVVSVTADIDEKVTNANKVLGELSKKQLPGIVGDYPGLSYSLEGEQREQREALVALLIGLILALLGIYALLAIPFKSYTQPIVVMTAIPFGIIGAVGGHMLMGYELSLMSFFGIVALTGIVVNDSLVLIVRINEMRDIHDNVIDAIVQGGIARFRAILLTSLTTFLGLAPMVLETSVQAQFLVPMAISLGFGVLFATIIILVLVPSSYMILQDILGILSKIGDVLMGRSEQRATATHGSGEQSSTHAPAMRTTDLSPKSGL